MEIRTDRENMYTSTPKANSSKIINTDRKTLGTLQQFVTNESALEGKSRTPLHKFKDSDSSESKPKTKIYYDELNTQSTGHPVKIYEDPCLPEKWSQVHCSRACQTDDTLLKYLIQEKQILSDADDSGRVSGFIDPKFVDLVSEDSVSENYWKDLAEERRRALKETLEENEKLYLENDQLKAEIRRLSNVAAQAETLRELLEGMVSDDDDQADNEKNSDESKNLADTEDLVKDNTLNSKT